MAMNIILSIVILLFFSPIAFSYEYYTLAQEIPGTICKYQKCASAMMGSIGQSTMNLHGLWPDTANASLRPFNCLENLYDEDQLDPTVKSSMDKNWVGLYNSTFWFRWHEWGKHGTCWEDNSYLGEKNQKT